MVILSWNVLVQAKTSNKLPPQDTRVQRIIDAINLVSPDVAGLYELDEYRKESISAKIGHNFAKTIDYESPKMHFLMSLSSRNVQKKCKST